MKKLALAVVLIAALVGISLGSIAMATSDSTGKAWSGSSPRIYIDRGSVTGGPGRISAPIPYWGAPGVPCVAHLIMDVTELVSGDVVQVNVRITGVSGDFYNLYREIIPPSGPGTAYQVFDFPAEEFYINVDTIQTNVTVHYSVIWETIAIQTPLEVRTDPATDVTVSSATLNGYLIGLGTATSVDVYFNAGHDTDYGYSIPVGTLSAPGPFSYVINLSSIAPGTTIHYRARAVGDGTDYGGDEYFTIPTGGG